MEKNNSFSFVKMTGGGNDFVLFDNRRGQLPLDYSSLARKVCDRKFSIGADGLLVLEEAPGVQFRMVYYNSDGSRAEMCGNGARCIARFARMVEAAPDAMRFETDAGVLSAEIRGQTVKVRMSDPKDMRLDLSLKLENGREFGVSSLNTGVPHAMVLVTDLEKIDVPNLGREIRYHREFAPAGTNANFVQVRDDRTIAVRTYERGVEGETLACGTGVTACAVLCAAKGLARSPVSCLTRGGDALTVYFELERGPDGAPAARDVFLEGPATVCFRGEVEL